MDVRWVTHPIDHYVCWELPPGTNFQPSSECFSIRTCLRFEVFSFGVPNEINEDVKPLGIHRGWDAFYRLIYICCGAASSLIGETEVFGQVKRAYFDQASHLDRRLHWMIQAAFRAAKALRSTHPLRSGPSSYGGWVRRRILESGFESSKSNILFVGAGHMVKEIAHFVAPLFTPNQLFWMNRTREHAEHMQKQHGGAVLDFHLHHIGEFPLVLMAITPEINTLQVLSSHWWRWQEKCEATPGQGDRYLAIDLSSPTTIPESMRGNPKCVTLHHLNHVSQLEQKRRQDKQSQLKTLIAQWIQDRYAEKCPVMSQARYREL